MNKTIEWYNENAFECMAFYSSMKFEDAHRYVLNEIPSVPGKVLDIGSGSGRDTRWFSNNGWEVVSLEPAQDLLCLAQFMNPNITWTEGELPDTGWEDDYFDLIWLSSVWNHIKPSDRVDSLINMLNMLAPGGKIIMSYRSIGFKDKREYYPQSSGDLHKMVTPLLTPPYKIETHLDCEDLTRKDLYWDYTIIQNC